MAVCLTCGQPLPKPASLIDRLRADRRRCVYAAADGGYYIEYGGGKTTRAEIDAALKAGLIVPKWPDKPELEYWRLVQ